MHTRTYSPLRIQRGKRSPAPCEPHTFHSEESTMNPQCRICHTDLEPANARRFHYGSHAPANGEVKSEQEFTLCPRHDTDLHRYIFDWITTHTWTVPPGSYRQARGALRPEPSSADVPPVP